MQKQKLLRETSRRVHTDCTTTNLWFGELGNEHDRAVPNLGADKITQSLTWALEMI